jgi:hypothetical protein
MIERDQFCYMKVEYKKGSYISVEFKFIYVDVHRVVMDISVY